MAQRGTDITDTPVDIKTIAHLSLVEGTKYFVRNLSSTVILYAAVDAEPDPDTYQDWLPLPADEPGFLTVPTTKFWMMVRSGKARLVVDETP